ncbi:MAG: hypothetical protein IT355_12200 [Gemmatimonadaceae bacterium]|nr:hypothetical protein [Gemmatimonadaceae bacterium]
MMPPRPSRAQLLVLIAATLHAGLSPAWAQSAPRRAGAPGALVTRAAAAVVTIVAYRAGTSEVTSAVGVRVSDGRVLTTLRHLRGAVRAEVFDARGDLLGTATGLEQAEVTLDLAVIGQLTGPGARLTLARRAAGPAQKLSLLEPRRGAASTIVERVVTHVEPDDAGRTVLRIGAPVPGAAAGSPLVNARGELVAIALGTMPARDYNDAAVDVSAIRDLLARPPVRLGLPAVDGTIAASRAAIPDGRAGAPAIAAGRGTEPAAGRGIFPERYGVAIGGDTAGTWAVELFGCARLESRRKVYCYLRVTNLARSATFAVSGGDLTDSTRRRRRAAETLVTANAEQRVAGWRRKAEVPLRELESARMALEFTPPETDTDAVRLMVDVSGERALWFGPFVLQRAP